MVRLDGRIRVGVFTKPLDNWTSGSGHHLDEILRHALDLNDSMGKPFDFTFLHYATSKNDVYGRVREMIIPRNPLLSAGVLRRERFDLVHYSPLTVFSPIWFVPGKKTATVHGVEEVLFPQGYSRLHRAHEALVMPSYMRRMDAVATVSETSKRFFVEKYGVRANRVFITTNGIGAAYRVIPADERGPLPITNIDRPYILHVSKYSARKNPDAIFRGFASFLSATGLDYLLVCAGRGWDSHEATTAAQLAGIGNRYRAPGFVSEADAVSLLNGAEAFVFPSYAEGFGMPNLEAMACGCPVVTSGVFAIPEVVGDAAYVLSSPDAHGEIGQALARIAKDAGYKKALVSRGLERVKRYSWDESARALLSRWASLAGRPELLA